MKPGVSGKDVIITLAGFFNNDEVLNHALEFTGDGVNELSVDQRLTIANMTTEWGALAGVFPIDIKTTEWLEQRAAYIEKRGLAGVPSDGDGNGQHPRLNTNKIQQLKKAIIEADLDAHYTKNITLELDTIRPYVSGPNSVKVMKSVEEIDKENIKIDKAYLVSCVNSRLEDITQAAQVVQGKKVAKGVEFYIAAASDEVQKESEMQGDWHRLIDAGAIPLPPGCGPCIGLGAGLLEDGEVGISATNRNFKGRMGSKNALAYLASPAVVAASAIAGKITSPFKLDSSKPIGKIVINTIKEDTKPETTIMKGFPEKLNGDLIFCHQDNLNTDGIYPGKYTYQDDITPEKQAEVVMENYDPEFVKIVKNGDVLVGGFNFGTGSSREQAATALKYKGIQLVLAGSFSETYKRNAINNGFLVIECPLLVKDLKDKYDSQNLTLKTDLQAEIDFKKSQINVDGKEYKIAPVGLSAQELIISGGLEEWVKKNI
ncbi:MAG: aconitase family protein [Calditrichaceae bacterium]